MYVNAIVHIDSMAYLVEAEKRRRSLNHKMALQQIRRTTTIAFSNTTHLEAAHTVVNLSQDLRVQLFLNHFLLASRS